MKRILPWLLIALGIVCLGFGAWRGEWQTVLSRAALICLTCIGIG